MTDLQCVRRVPEDNDQVTQRKADHIRINLENDVQSRARTGLERYRFVHEALPDLDMARIDTSVTLFGKVLAAPILISSMTGGTEQAQKINRNLAAAAQHMRLPMGLGSMRAAIVRPDSIASFHVRDVAPTAMIFANVGAVQLNYGITPDDCRRLVDLVEAEALILHLNPLQEATQPEGDTNWVGLAGRIAVVVRQVGVPVIVKEVGWGISERAARTLVEAGVAAIDVAGAGGTSWSQVEMYRAESDKQRRIAQAFDDWGIPTAEAITGVRRSAPGLPVFASGGIVNGVEGAKCLALGATLFGMARPLLRAATQSVEAVLAELEIAVGQLRVAMLCTGSANLEAMSHAELVRIA